MSLQKALEFFEENPGHLKTSSARIALRLNTSLDDVIEARRIYRQRLRDKVSLKGDFTTIEEKEDWTNKSKEKGVETQYKKFLERNGIKEEDVVNVYYKEKSDGIRFTVQTKSKREELVDGEEIYEYLSKYEFKPSPIIDDYKSYQVTAVLNIFDAHIDKLSFTNNGEVGLQENLDKLYDFFKQLLYGILEHNPSLIIFPIGNDFFNTNGSSGATKAGTPQDTYVGWRESFQAGLEFYRRCIDTITQYTSVYLVDIPGNHDSDQVFYLSQILKAVYEDNTRVLMNFSKSPRKYILTNSVLFGFGHGKTEVKRMKDLPTVMALEVPEHWADAEHRVWILGDKHHSEKYKVIESIEHNGVDIEIFRAASDTDEWHHNQMWIAAKKSISALIYKDSGKRIIKDELFI